MSTQAARRSTLSGEAASPRGEGKAGATSAPAVDAVLELLKERLEARQLPASTYRLQFNSSFTFRDARELVPYLHALGITHCYASPYLKSRAGSRHGYDIVDHTALNPELGTDADYEEFVRELRRHDMGHILDFVPNHMSVDSSDNAWWMDVLEHGPSSPYASFFDIDWMPLKPDLAHKVLLPVLGDQYGKVLEEGRFELQFDDGAFGLRYETSRFPISVRSTALILRHRLEELKGRLSDDHPYVIEYQSILTAIKNLPPRTESDAELIQAGRRECEVIRRRLAALCDASPDVKEFVAENVRLFNGRPGDPHSFDLLDALLLDQAYRLSFWRVAADEINYRRFFDVNQLAAICMENPSVFEKAHSLVFRLISAGKIDGLRMDHLDGLYDPCDYLAHVQQACLELFAGQVFDDLSEWSRGEDNSLHEPPDRATVLKSLLTLRDMERSERGDSLLIQPLYTVVEKILATGERLPGEWPIHGTTGYEFVNAVNGLFVDSRHAKSFDAIYSRFIKQRMDFSDLVYRCKKVIMDASMSGEINVLGHHLDRLSEEDRSSRDFTLRSLTDAIREVIACFPVYRTYITAAGASEKDRQYVERAVARAGRKNPAVNRSIFNFVRDLLLLKHPDHADEAAVARRVRFVSHFQRVTSPITAKGVEDTAFYVYNRLVSLNEVGSDPEKFGIPPATFHQQNLERQAKWPFSLLATSTHDTKRSEDVRARLNVLSEMPVEWRSRVFQWSRLNRRKKTEVDGELAPSRNDEYLIYQTLVGTWPFEPMNPEQHAQYVRRIQQHMLKATHEAKVNTSWINPHLPYEQATEQFINATLSDSPRNIFLREYQPFAQRIAEYGIWNSLSQTLLKLACPGVPDLYQGTELWDFSLVDPDNRRPVDYASRRTALQSLRTLNGTASSEVENFSSDLIGHRHDGRIKLHVIVQALNHRRAHPDLYTTGNYIPLEPTGVYKEHVCAFARQTARHAVIVVVPRLVTRLGGGDRPPIGADVWKDTALSLPSDFSGHHFRNILTGEALALPVNAALALSSILNTFPVALLEVVHQHQ
ncbi:MAG: malto-oligosyltrehalose synthase [Pirellulales bacterium]